MLRTPNVRRKNGTFAIALLAAAIAATAFALLVPAASARAQEPVRRTAGDYEISVSYRDEPLLEVGNALMIEVRDLSSGRPVTGLEQTLEASGLVTVDEVIRPVPVYLRPYMGRPGVYEGVFVPPAIGDYRFTVTGYIGNTRVNQVFTSGEGGLPEATVAEDSFTSVGALIALALLAVFLVGLAVIGGLQIRMRRRSRHVTA